MVIVGGIIRFYLYECVLNFQLPIDISTLTEEELEALKRKRKPKEVFVEEKEIEDSFDRNKYSKYWKR